jgi:hypothetical protein
MECCRNMIGIGKVSSTSEKVGFAKVGQVA